MQASSVQTPTTPTGAFLRMVEKSGPMAVALVLVCAALWFLYQYVIRPGGEMMLAVSANAKESSINLLAASANQKDATNKLTGAMEMQSRDAELTRRLLDRLLEKETGLAPKDGPQR